MHIDYKEKYIMIIKVSIPGQPVAKSRPRFSFKSKRAYTPKKTKDYEELIKEYVKPLVDGTLSGPIDAHFIIVFKRPKYMMTKKYKDQLLLHTKRPDLDNVIKAVMDALNSILDDDSQICKITAEKYYSDKSQLPFTHIQLTEIK